MAAPELSLGQLAGECLLETEPAEKIRRLDALIDVWRMGQLGTLAVTECVQTEWPGRPQKPRLVHPGRVPKRGLGSDQGRVALIHAVAHIEFNAINLALDAVCRFPGLPADYYDDWLSVAGEEALHFQMLTERLAEHGAAYGDLDAHDGLWEMAKRTDHDPLSRMALGPRLMEARGLDVTPGMIERLESVGDTRTVRILKKILQDEIGHVEKGSRWFRWLCEQRGLDPDAHFLKLIQDYVKGSLRGPFNLEARREAGFSDYELGELCV